MLLGIPHLAAHFAGLVSHNSPYRSSVNSTLMMARTADLAPGGKHLGKTEVVMVGPVALWATWASGIEMDGYR